MPRHGYTLVMHMYIPNAASSNDAIKIPNNPGLIFQGISGSPITSYNFLIYFPRLCKV